MALESWRWSDPFEVYSRIERHAQKQAAKAIRKAQDPFGDDMVDMSTETSDEIEEVLMIWFQHERSYKQPLGAPSVSVYAKDYRTSETKRSDSDLRDDVEDKLNKIIAESVEACVASLPGLQKSAVELHCAAKHSGCSVIRNPRMTLEQHHEMYQAAKLTLWPMLKRRGLVK